MEPPSDDLGALTQQMAVDRARLDALRARVDALELEVPLGQVEVREELARLEQLLDAVLDRLTAPESSTPAAPARPRGVIGALRAERGDGDPAPA